MTLSEFIRQHSESVLADSGHRGRAPLIARNGRVCRHGSGYLVEVLLAACDCLDAAHSGRDGGTSALETWARRHADERMARHQTLNELVAEIHALRRLVIRAWQSEGQPAADTAIDQVSAFTDAIDRVLATGVACYDERLRQAAAEQAELHERLAQSEQRFRALVNATSHVVYRLSPDGTEMRALDGRGVVADTTEPSTSWLDEYIHPDDQPLAIQAFQQAFRDKTLYQVEHRYRRVSGKLGWTLSRAVPLFDDQGRIVEWFGAATDVTARRQVEETLREADRRKEEFLVILGHELRNPLAPLRTCVDLLEQAERKPELLATLRPMMDRQLSHLVRLVDDLLDISRIGRGEIRLDRAALDLNAPVEAAIEQARPLIAERRHVLDVRLVPAPLPVVGDAVRLTQVVTNLLTNAAKYMDPGGTIRISSSAEGARAVVRVRDTGYGFSPEQSDKLFRLFSQIDADPARSGGGLGVGLALSRQLVNLHGGAIEAHSDGIGRGSEFVVRLALAQ